MKILESKISYGSYAALIESQIRLENINALCYLESKYEKNIGDSRIIKGLVFVVLLFFFFIISNEFEIENDTYEVVFFFLFVLFTKSSKILLPDVIISSSNEVFLFQDIVIEKRRFFCKRILAFTKDETKKKFDFAGLLDWIPTDASLKSNLVSLAGNVIVSIKKFGIKLNLSELGSVFLSDARFTLFFYREPRKELVKKEIRLKLFAKRFLV